MASKKRKEKIPCLNWRRFVKAEEQIPWEMKQLADNGKRKLHYPETFSTEATQDTLDLTFLVWLSEANKHCNTSQTQWIRNNPRKSEKKDDSCLTQQWWSLVPQQIHKTYNTLSLSSLLSLFFCLLILVYRGFTMI